MGLIMIRNNVIDLAKERERRKPIRQVGVRYEYCQIIDFALLVKAKEVVRRIRAAVHGGNYGN